MKLIINIGNTSTALCCFRDDGEFNVMRTPTHSRNTSRQWFDVLPQESPLGVGIASVVPEVTAVLVEALQTAYPRISIELIDSQSPWSFRNLTREPAKVGTDRLANAQAALTHFPHCHNIVIDAGTTTTLSVVNAAGEFLGGAIAPGLELCRDALATRGAQLFSAPLRPGPSSAIGRDTSEAMQSGVVFGHVGTISYLLDRTREELKTSAPGTDIKITATGGAFPLLGSFLPTVDLFDPVFTLKGLYDVYERLSR